MHILTARHVRIFPSCTILKWSHHLMHSAETLRCCSQSVHIRGGGDKSLARPGRKQATATKLGIYSINSSARCSIFCKPRIIYYTDYNYCIISIMYISLKILYTYAYLGFLIHRHT